MIGLHEWYFFRDWRLGQKQEAGAWGYHLRLPEAASQWCCMCILSSEQLISPSQLRQGVGRIPLESSAQVQQHHIFIFRMRLTFLSLCCQCNLVPTDEVTVYYKAVSEGNYLNNVIESHTEFIFATIKAPLKPYPVPTSDKILIQEKMQVKPFKRWKIKFHVRSW